MSGIFGQNALAWGQFHLRGGVRNVLLTTAAYAVGISGLIYVTLAVERRNTTSMLEGWVHGLLVLQVLMLCVFGSSAVSASVRKDLASGMLESHRLMPISPPWAIAGYLLGSCSQAIALGLANLVIGLSISHGAGVTVEQWLVPNAIVAVQAVFLWCTLTCLTYQHKYAFWVLFIAGIVFAAPAGMLIISLPALPLLFSLLIGPTIFSLRFTIDNLSMEFAVAMITQLAFAAIFFVGSSRKYRRSDATALGVLPALMLLAAWVAASAISVANWSDFRPGMYGRQDGMEQTQFIGSMLAAMLLAIIPIANSGRADSQWRQRARLRDPALGARPLPPLLIALAAPAIVVCLCKAAPNVRHDNIAPFVAQTACAVGAFALAISYLLRIFYRAGRKATWVAGIFLGITWLAPILIDVVRSSLSNDLGGDVLTTISTASPIGALYHIWFGQISATPGLAFQSFLAVAAIILYHTTAPRPTATPPPLPV